MRSSRSNSVAKAISKEIGNKQRGYRDGEMKLRRADGWEIPQVWPMKNPKSDPISCQTNYFRWRPVFAQVWGTIHPLPCGKP